MIDSVWIRDFRGLHTAHVTGLSSINVLVGPNNSGKTAFLEALYLGCGVGEEFRLSGPHVQRSFIPLAKLPSTDFVDEHPLALVRRKHLHSLSRTTPLRLAPPSGAIPAALRVDVKSALLNRLHSGLQLNPNDPLRIEDWPASRLQLTTWFRFDPWLVKVFSEVQLPEMEQAIRQAQDAGTAHNAVFCWDRALTYHYVGTAAWGMSGALPTAKHTFFYDAHQTLAHIPTDFYTNMISVVPGWSQKIAERVGRVLGITEPFNVLFMPTGPDKEWMQGQIAFADRPALPIDDFGDGARAVFKVLAPLIALAELVTEEEPGIFLWEEPELFQNPLTLGRLLAEVADLAQSRPLQVFMATHSLEVVAHLVQQVQAGTLKEEALCTLRTQLHKGDFTAHSFSTDDIRTWTRMQRDLRVPDGFTGSPLHFSIEGPAGSEAASDDGDGDE